MQVTQLGANWFATMGVSLQRVYVRFSMGQYEYLNYKN